MNELEKLLKWNTALIFQIKRTEENGIFFSHAEGRLTNELGLKPHALDNHQPIHFFGTDTAMHALINSFNGVEQSFEFRKKSKYYNVNLHPVWDADGDSGSNRSVTSIIGTAFDISDKRKAERKLSLFAHTLNSLNEAVSVTDAEDRIIYVNPAFCKMYGYENEEVIGEKSSILWSPKNSSRLTEQIFPATMSGGWSGQLYNRKKDGSDFLISLRTSAVMSDNNEIIGCVGIAMESGN